VVAVAVREENGLHRLHAETTPGQRVQDGLGLAIVTGVDERATVVVDVDDDAETMPSLTTSTPSSRWPSAMGSPPRR